MNTTRIFSGLMLIAGLALAPVTSQARYFDPSTGRFNAMDSYDGNRSDPQSLHKHAYAHADPVNNSDPSGHFVGSALTVDVLATVNVMTQLRQVEARSKMAVPGHLAARGFVKWAWLTGGIAIGAQYLLEDSQLAMEIQLAVKANPTASPHAYENYKCVEFAADAEKVFRKRGDYPQLITYRSRPNRTVGDNIMAAPGFGFFGGENVALFTGFHVGVLVKERVYDNNVPFGVSRAAWESGYLVTAWPEYQEMTIGQAARIGVGDITVR